MRTFKQSLRELRLKQKLKQIDVCEKLNIASNTYSQYENKKRQPDFNLVPKLAKILNCSIEDIVLSFCDNN